VRVPEPLNFVEGVLVMELVKGEDGEAAPRLGDLEFSPSEAQEIYDRLIQDVVRMLCAGVVHGDLSDFNVLLSHDGPVIIDFPQSVDPTQNPNSEKLLLRDVSNLHRFLSRFAPDAVIRSYGEEIWKLYCSNKLTPDTQLTGTYQAPQGKVDTKEVMALIDEANRDEAKKQRGNDREEADTLDGVVPDAIFDTTSGAKPGTKPGTMSAETPDTALGATSLRRVVDFSHERAAEKRKVRGGGGGRKPGGATSEETPPARDAKRRPRGRGRGPASERSRTAGRSTNATVGSSANPPTGPASTREGNAGAAPSGPRRTARKSRSGSSRARNSSSADESITSADRATPKDATESPKRSRGRRSRGRSRGRGGSEGSATADSGRSDEPSVDRPGRGPGRGRSGSEEGRTRRPASDEPSRGPDKPSSRSRRKPAERGAAKPTGSPGESIASGKDPRSPVNESGDRAPRRRRRRRPGKSSTSQ
jgi:RIO kinase 1